MPFVGISRPYGMPLTVNRFRRVDKAAATVEWLVVSSDEWNVTCNIGILSHCCISSFFFYQWVSGWVSGSHQPPQTVRSHLLEGWMSARCETGWVQVFIDYLFKLSNLFFCGLLRFCFWILTHTSSLIVHTHSFPLCGIPRSHHQVNRGLFYTGPLVSDLQVWKLLNSLFLELTYCSCAMHTIRSGWWTYGFLLS